MHHNHIIAILQLQIICKNITRKPCGRKKFDFESKIHRSNQSHSYFQINHLPERKIVHQNRLYHVRYAEIRRPVIITVSHHVKDAR